MLSQRTRAAIFLAVTVVWVTNFLATILIEGYIPLESVNGAFAAVLAGLVALGRKEDEPPDAPEEAETSDGE